MDPSDLEKEQGSKEDISRMSEVFRKRLADAEDGDIRAQYDVGVFYQEGRGVPQDFEEAAKWFRCSAEQDDFAEYCIRVVLQDLGMERSQDHEEIAGWFRQAAETVWENSPVPLNSGEVTIKWMKLAADHGSVFAMSNLGFIYMDSPDVPQDYAESAKWMRLAADRGDSFSQTALGHMYEEGLGVPRSNEEAVKWYRLAAEQGHGVAKKSLERLTNKPA